jgi:hypothetical protein
MGPSFDWKQDAFGYVEHLVNIAMDLVWLGVTSDRKGSTVAGWQAHGHHLVSRQLLAQGLPGSVNALFEEGAFYADQ